MAAALGIRPGMTVAEIGAGTGAMAVEMARIVGRDGQVIATELGPGKLAAIRETARRAGVSNLSVLAAAEHATNLPLACCEAIYMQRVYHHLTDPAGVIESARQALKPGGRLAVIDFEPGGIKNLSTPRGVPDRGGHGVPKDALVREMRSFGLMLRGGLVDWPDGEYLGVFVATSSGSRTKPRTTREIPALAAAFVEPDRRLLR